MNSLSTSNTLSLSSSRCALLRGLVWLVLPISVLACGDNSNGNHPGPDAAASSDASTPDAASLDATLGCTTGNPTDAPAVTIVFPPQQALTDTAEILVRGTATGATTVTTVEINGVVAQSSNGFGDWQALVPLVPGTNELVVTSADDQGNRNCTAATAQVTLAPAILFWPRFNAVDAANNRLLVADGNLVDHWITAVDLTTRSRTIVSGRGIGTGPQLGTLSGLIIDSAHQRLITVEGSAPSIVAIDPVTGDRSVLSSPTQGSGPIFRRGSFVALDSARSRLLAVGDSGGNKLILAVDPATGDRTILSGGTTGTGPSINLLMSMVMDPAGDRLLIADSQGALLAVDLDTGNRTLVASGSWQPESIALDPTGRRVYLTARGPGALLALDVEASSLSVVSSIDQGTGEVLDRPQGLAVHPVTGRIYAGDTSLYQVFEIDPVTGDRARLSDTTLGSGPAPREPIHVVLDESRGRILAWEQRSASLLAVDSATGNRTPVLDPDGNPPPLANIAALALSGDRLLSLRTVSAPYLASWNVTTGAFAVISDETTGTGPLLAAGKDMELDPANNRVIATVNSSASEPGILLVWIDLDTGNRTAVAGDDTGSMLWGPASVALDLAGNRALVADEDPESITWRIVAVDLATGAGSLLDGGDFSSDDDLPAIHDLVLDRDRNRLLVMLSYDGKETLMGIDLATGTRTVVSEPGTAGRGPVTVNPRTMEMSRSGEYVIMGDRQLQAVLAIDVVTGERVIISR